MVLNLKNQSSQMNIEQKDSKDLKEQSILLKQPQEIEAPSKTQVKEA